MPPTRAARWMTISGRWSWYIRATSACLVRLYSALEKVATFAPRDSTSRTTWRPRKPRPPVTVTRFPAQKGLAAASWFDISPDFTTDVHGSTETASLESARPLRILFLSWRDPQNPKAGGAELF